MKQMTLAEYRETYFTPRSRPSIRKLRYLCETGELPAHKLGRIWYIDADSLPEEQVNKLVERALQS